jgi:hypothetical protein
MKYYGVMFCVLFSTLAVAQQNIPASKDIWSSGNAFLAQCEPSVDSWAGWSDGECRGYVSGLWDGISMMAPAYMCPSENVSKLQFYRVAFKYMHDHPEKTDKLTAILISQSWREAFPCPAKSK